MRYKTLLAITLVLAVAFMITAVVLLFNYLPEKTSFLFGPSDIKLDFAQRIIYSTRLLTMQEKLLKSAYSQGVDVEVMIKPGESADQVAGQLNQAGLITSADAFITFLKYSGLDIWIRAGEYSIPAGKNAIEITRLICDLNPERVKFVILPGMRVEEIAALLPTSGLKIKPQDLVEAVLHPQAQSLPDNLKGSTSLEGFLFPGEYEFARDVGINEFVQTLLNRFLSILSPELLSGWQNNKLSLFQGVNLASIIQREVIQPDEAPLVASVFINRLAEGMKLQSDPTVQYAVGNAKNGWWKVPLTQDDLSYPSTFNTYQFADLPPTPICNPDINSLRASAQPLKTNYLFFQAKCDQSGRHQFFASYAEQLASLCQ
jgi:UPF0755 protein